MILKETRLMDNFDESSKKCLKSLSEAIFSNESLDNQGLIEGGLFMQ